MKNIKITDFKTKKINKLTGGRIDNYQIDVSFNLSKGEEEEYRLPNSFVTQDGKFVGDYSRGWWYVINNLKICEDYPHGVAEKYEDGKLVAYYGYTHRGGNLFYVGDRLFDEKYKPVKKDYSEKEWAEWEEKFNNSLEKADDFDRKWMLEDGISCIIPFKMRGHKIIETLEEAKQAAINMSKYLG